MSFAVQHTNFQNIAKLWDGTPQTSILSKILPATPHTTPRLEASAQPDIKSGSQTSHLADISTEQAISRWSLPEDKVSWLTKPNVTHEDLASLKDTYVKAVQALHHGYIEAGLPTDKFQLDTDKAWNKLTAKLEQKFFNKGKSAPAQLIIGAINETAHTELAGGFLTFRSPQDIQEGLVKQVKSDMRAGFQPTAVECDSILDKIIGTKETGSHSDEYYVHDGVVKIEQGQEQVAVASLNNSTAQIAISHLKSGLNAAQTAANLKSMGEILGQHNESIHLSDMNVDVTDSNVMSKIRTLAEEKGYTSIIPDSRYSKIRLGNNDQPHKEQPKPIEAESMIAFAKKDLSPKAEYGSRAITPETQLDKLEYKTTGIFTDALPGDHHPVRLSIHKDNQDLKFAFYNLLGSQSGPHPFYSGRPLSTEDIFVMNDLHTAVKSAATSDLQAYFAAKEQSAAI